LSLIDLQPGWFILLLLKGLIKKSVFILAAVLLPFIAANEIIRWVWFNKYSFVRLAAIDWQYMSSLRPGLHEYFKVGDLNPVIWKDKNLGWELSVNAQGFRGQRKIEPKRANIFRIICLGDSITFGLDVDDHLTYPSQLEQLLNEAVNNRHQIDVINAGVPGYSSRQGLIRLSRDLIHYQPDLVILEFGFNDASAKLGGTLFPSDKQILKGSIDSGWGKAYDSPYSLACFLIDRQPLIVLAKSVLINYLLSRRFLPAIAKMSESDFRKILERKSISAASREFKNSRVPPGDFVENLNQIVRLANDQEFRLVFYIPYAVTPSYRLLILNEAREYGIPVVDFFGQTRGYGFEDLIKNPGYAQLLAPYRKALGDDFLRENREFLVTTDMLHPNALGNRIIAEEMAKTIITHRSYILYRGREILYPQPGP